MSPQTNQSLVCPKCGESIPLTESFTAPIIASAHAQYESQLSVDRTRIQDLLDAKAALELRMQDRDSTISKLRSEIAGLQRSAEQGSQQLQGESLELILEGQLRAHFPLDLIDPVPKGEFGGDVLQVVRDDTGHLRGKILWESKRTKKWNPGWLKKLKNDQRVANAEFAVLVSQAIPKDITLFKQMDGVWVSSLSCFIPLANALRISVIEFDRIRRSSEGKETKALQTYAYLTGPRFKHRVECIAERFIELRKDLEAERKWMTNQWKKRDIELTAVLEATSGMYSDLQDIAGQSLMEIDSLEGPTLLKLESLPPKSDLD